MTSERPIYEWHCQCDRCVTTTYDKRLAPRCRHCHRDMILQDETDAILQRIKQGGK